MEYVLKHFNMFTKESQMKHLIYIRDKVHSSLAQGNAMKKVKFLKCMAETPCIPDHCGYLHSARDFFDPNNDVFKVMYEDDNNKFPPSPFNKTDWLDLLQDIGLQVDITAKLFLECCTTVAEDARYFPRNIHCHKKSEVLVKCLLSENFLKEEEFLSQVSQIRFIAPAKVEEELASIHQQYQCSINGYPPFINFKNAVPWRYKFITWTTAPLLPTWAQPNNMAEMENLGIACSGPMYTNVLDHLENVVTSDNLDLVNNGQLHEITKAIYQFLFKSTKCCGRNPSDECSEVCKNIGTRLKSVPCIILPEDETFVKAEQLVFQLFETCPLKPFLHAVPREFGELEHFLKRLGATEKPTVLQVAYVLDSIHEEVGEEVLSPGMEEKVTYAMRMLFGLLNKGESADGIDELYLPSQDKHLIKSCEMICKVSSRYADFIGELQRPVLLRFEECGLKNVADDYIDALPEHLRPAKFDEKVREEVDPECQVSICPKTRHNSICTFQQRFQNLLRSDEFQEGLKRLLVENRQDPQEFEHRIKKLQTHVKTNCIGSENVKIRVIDRNTNEVVGNLEDSCYAVQEEDAWSLYMQHKFKDYRGLVSTVTCVNKILGDCIQEKMGLIAMLGCTSPSEIERELNKLDITQSTCKTADDCDDLDDELFSECDESGGGGGDGRSDGFGGIGMNDGGSHRTIRSMRDGASFDGQSRIKNEVEDEKFYPKNREEATRWLQQSQSDLKNARWSLKSGPPFSAHAYFQSQQAVEKCLKAMLFYSCGISGQLLGSHEVVELARKLREETGKPDEDDLKSVRQVARYYLSTRYPNRQPPNVVPANAFNKNEAEAAVDAASKVIKLVEEYCL